MNEDDIFYRLDRHDRIVEVGGAWTRAARDGEGVGLDPSEIEGTNLFKHINGRATRSFVWTILDATRKLQAPRSHLYRCDTPDLRRNMEMTIALDDADGLLLTHRVVSVGARARRTPLPARSGAGPGGPRIAVRCSMCCQVRVDGKWLELDALTRSVDTSATGSPDSSASDPTIIYGVCNSCRELAAIVRPPASE